MSASREKKKRQDNLASGIIDPRTAREETRRKEAKKSRALTITVFALIVVAAVAVFVYNSGVIQRNKTAVTIDGQEYSAADISYHYQAAFQNFMQSQEGYMALQYGLLDPKKPLSSQPAWGDEEETWADFFRDQAVSNVKYVHAVASAAKANGVALEDKEREIVDANVQALKDAAKKNGYSYKAYVSAVYGPLVTPSVFVSNLEEQVLAEKYALAYIDGLTFTDDELQAYYEENKNTYDLVDGAYIAISGQPEAKFDDEGNPLEPTDEDSKAAMTDAKALADKIYADVKDGKDLSELAEENELSATVNDEMHYSSGKHMDWLFDTSRKAGDSAVLEDEDSGKCYVVLFNGRERNEAPSYSVRHILINDGNLELAEGEKGTDEQHLAIAEEILASWDGTEDGFAKLAADHSQDNSRENGGLYEDVHKGQMVAEFEDWCYEDGRKAGDTGIVKSQFGEHIMYFVGYGDTTYWQYGCKNALSNKSYSQWKNDLLKEVTADINDSVMASIG